MNIHPVEAELFHADR